MNSLEKITELSLLYDLYGALLTERQSDVMELYYEENLSIIEIADELSITKQGVHEALKKAEKLLTNYEAKLGLYRKLKESNDIIKLVNEKISLLKEMKLPKEANDILGEIKEITDKLED